MIEASPSIFGFGFDPAKSTYHFAAVQVSGDRAITIEERFTWGSDEAGDGESRRPVQKAVLDEYRWSRVRETVRAHFNRRLKLDGLPEGRWGAKETVLASHLGKELTLLAWAIEDADPTVIPTMAANWLGLAPEERWWLYTTINATAGHPFHGRERGWRKAIKIAFAENPADAPASTLLDAGYEGVPLPLTLSSADPEPTQPGIVGSAGRQTLRPDMSNSTDRAVQATDSTVRSPRPRKRGSRAQLPLIPDERG